MASAEEMYQTAMNLNDESNYEQRKEKLNELVSKYPDFASAHDALGAVYYQEKEYDKALTHIETAVRLDPSNATLQKNLGDFYYTILSQNENALVCYENALKLDPTDNELKYVTANILVSMHRFEDAKSLYQNILAAEPWRTDIEELIDKIKTHNQADTLESSDLAYKKAQSLSNGNDIKGAVDLLKKIIEKDPDFALAYNDLAVLQLQTGEIENVQECYEKAVSLDPENIVFRKNLAEYLLLVNNDIINALKHYLAILKDHPYDIETLMAAGKISENYDKKEEAKTFYEAILDVEPWNLEASERLAGLENIDVHSN